MAVKRDAYPVFQALLQMDYDTNVPKNNGVTALGIAALANQKKLFVSLLDAGADPHFVNEKGIGALYLAIKGKSKVLV